MRLAAAVALVALAGCGGSPAAKGRAPADAPRIERDLSPTEIIPADLDLVLRVDLARMRDGLGPLAADLLTKKALGGAREEEMAEALACAEVVWLGLRAAEIDSGDRVVVLEGKKCMPELGRGRWEKVRSGNGRLFIFDRQGEAPRAGTARIINLGNRATAFVSPVELDSVKRVLAAGPDPARGEPRAEGLLGFDLRPRPLPPALAKRFASIAAVLAGVERVKGTATLGDEGLVVRAEVIGKTPAGAEKAGKFLEALRESLKEGRYAEAVKASKVDVVEKTVAVKLTVPAKVLVAALTAK
jgi:hypothetical protein